MNESVLRELLNLVDAVCDERASEKQVDRLEQILAEETGAVEVYANYMLMHSDLYWQQVSIADQSLVSLGKKNPVSLTGRLFVALAAMLLVGSAIAFVILSGHGNDSNESGFLGAPIATVTGTRNCRWSVTQDGENKRDLIGFGSSILAGQKLELLEGLAEVTFDSGVRMIIEAPASVILSSDFESVLQDGKLTASVPHGAEGFKVACKGLTLVDRGTEFGVSSDDSGVTEVHVFDGLVDGYFNDSTGVSFKKVSWKTDDKILFKSATGEFRDVDKPRQFVRSLADSPAINKGLFALEDFDYSVGPLGGHNGGFGWGGSWENISVADGVPETNGVGAGTIPFANIDHLGNHAAISGQFNRIRRILGTSFSGVFDVANLIENQDGSRLIGRDGATVYLSFIQRVTKVGDSFYGFELNRGDGNKNRVLCIGHGAARGWTVGPPRTPDRSAGSTDWSVTSEFNGSNNKLLEFGGLGRETNEPTLIVIKIEFGDNNQDQISVFVNPDPNNVSHPLVIGKGNFAFDRIGIANFNGDKSFHVDHIRVGTSYSSVINPHRVPVSLGSSD